MKKKLFFLLSVKQGGGGGGLGQSKKSLSEIRPHGRKYSYNECSKGDKNGDSLSSLGNYVDNTLAPLKTT